MNFILRIIGVFAILQLGRSISDSFTAGYLTMFVVILFLGTTSQRKEEVTVIEEEK